MRLWDRLIRRQGYWEGMASGAAIFTTSYGSPDREPVMPQLTAFAQRANGSSAIVFAAILVRMIAVFRGAVPVPGQGRQAPVRHHGPGEAGGAVRAADDDG